MSFFDPFPLLFIPEYIRIDAEEIHTGIRVRLYAERGVMKKPETTVYLYLPCNTDEFILNQIKLGTFWTLNISSARNLTSEKERERTRSGGYWRSHRSFHRRRRRRQHSGIFSYLFFILCIRFPTRSTTPFPNSRFSFWIEFEIEIEKKNQKKNSSKIAMRPTTKLRFVRIYYKFISGVGHFHVRRIYLPFF